ncbi:CRISPR-associated endoribonuclease Cas6 [Rapidithrix thailandica]|uniref:CRISPR-associated endoribonuclease Cas6 n=1 Tax=Rapidithrix thailandica TaxID=413964 RepID=A0AAW9SAX5_9BACT
MRIHLFLSSNSEPVPFNYQSVLTGVLHKWIGASNGVHDHLSLYSFSWLNAGKAIKKGLDFPNGSKWFISVHHAELLKQIIKGIQTDPLVNWGMEVREICIEEEPDFYEEACFQVASPVFVKRRIGDRIQFFYHHDQQVDTYLTETLQSKLKTAGLDSDGVEVKFDKDYSRPKIKAITYRGIQSKGSVCPVIVKGSSEQIAFAWNVGVGNSTGIGFGALV